MDGQVDNYDQTLQNVDNEGEGRHNNGIISNWRHINSVPSTPNATMAIHHAVT